MGHETPLIFFPWKFHDHRWGHEKLFCKIHWPWNDVHGIFKWFSWDFHKSQFHRRPVIFIVLGNNKVCLTKSFCLNIAYVPIKLSLNIKQQQRVNKGPEG